MLNYPDGETIAGNYDFYLPENRDNHWKGPKTQQRKVKLIFHLDADE